MEKMELMVKTVSLPNLKLKTDIGIFPMTMSNLGQNLVKQQVIVALMERMEIIFSRECPLKMALFASF